MSMRDLFFSKNVNIHRVLLRSSFLALLHHNKIILIVERAKNKFVEYILLMRRSRYGSSSTTDSVVVH